MRPLPLRHAVTALVRGVAGLGPERARQILQTAYRQSGERPGNEEGGLFPPRVAPWDPVAAALNQAAALAAAGEEECAVGVEAAFWAVLAGASTPPAPAAAGAAVGAPQVAKTQSSGLCSRRSNGQLPAPSSWPRRRARNGCPAGGHNAREGRGDHVVAGRGPAPCPGGRGRRTGQYRGGTAQLQQHTGAGSHGHRGRISTRRRDAARGEDRYCGLRPCCGIRRGQPAAGGPCEGPPEGRDARGQACDAGLPAPSRDDPEEFAEIAEEARSLGAGDAGNLTHDPHTEAARSRGRRQDAPGARSGASRPRRYESPGVSRCWSAETTARMTPLSG